MFSRHATKLCGVTSIALTKLDILSHMESIRVCTGYSLRGETLQVPPAVGTDIDQVKPIYETLPGWQKDISDAKRLSDLPKQARLYIEKIEEMVEVPVDYVSIGADRMQTIVVNQEI